MRTVRTQKYLPNLPLEETREALKTQHRPLQQSAEIAIHGIAMPPYLLAQIREENLRLHRLHRPHCFFQGRMRL